MIGKFKGTPYEFKTVGCDYRRKIEEAGLQINRNGNLKCQQIICDTLIEQLDIIKGMGSGNYITDRSPIDAYAYSVYLMRHNPESGVTQLALDDMFKKVCDSILAYDKIIYIDLAKCENVKVTDDKFRDTNLEYRTEIDSIFKETFAYIGNDILDKRLCDSISGNRNERVEKFVELFKDILVEKEI